MIASEFIGVCLSILGSIIGVNSENFSSLNLNGSNFALFTIAVGDVLPIFGFEGTKDSKLPSSTPRHVRGVLEPFSSLLFIPSKNISCNYSIYGRMMSMLNRVTIRLYLNSGGSEWQGTLAHCLQPTISRDRKCRMGS